MPAILPLQPTLWRTCRAIANHTRLEILRLLLDDSGQTVSALAKRLRRRPSITSQYLRTLEARGLLTARRTGRWVVYRLSPATRQNAMSGLVAALRATFRCESKPVTTIFRLATAFTHPRRIEIFRALQAGPRTPREIQAVTGISGWALSRHLRKLEARGFVTPRDRQWAAAHRSDRLGSELARLAAE